jgi:hypothetical protein
MTGSAPSPVTRLIIFMVCLSLFGSILATVHYYAVDLPQESSPGF